MVKAPSDVGAHHFFANGNKPYNNKVFISGHAYKSKMYNVQ